MPGLVAVDLERPFCMDRLIARQRCDYKAAAIIGRYSLVRFAAGILRYDVLQLRPAVRVHRSGRSLKGANVGEHRETVASRW